RRRRAVVGTEVRMGVDRERHEAGRGSVARGRRDGHRGHRRHGQDMLRLIAGTAVASLLMATAAHAAHGDRPGASSTADYEFLGGAAAETMALASPEFAESA